MVSFGQWPSVVAAVPVERIIKECGPTPGNACRWVMEKTNNRVLASIADALAGPVLGVIVIWVVAVIVNRGLRFLIKRVGKRIEGAAHSGRLQRWRDKTPGLLLNTGTVGVRSASRAKTTTGVLRSVSSVLVYSIATLYTLDELGLRVGPLLAGAGIIGVALGFGAQSMVRDFLGGTFMLMEDQFGVGDSIDVASTVSGSPGISGTVEAVTLRTTSIRDVFGTIWHIPNGEIRRVGNKSQGWARALLDVSVPYGTDLVMATDLIRSVAEEVAQSREFGPEILDRPDVWGVEDLGPDAVVIRLVVKTRPGEQWPVMRALREKMHDALEDAGIAHPFPQRSIWMSGDSEEPAVSPTEQSSDE